MTSLQRAELGVDYSCVRACVRLPPRGSSRPIVLRILSEISENHVCILQDLVMVASKTPHNLKRYTFFVKCSKHTIKQEVELVNFNTSKLKSEVKSSHINTSQLKSGLSTSPLPSYLLSPSISSPISPFYSPLPSSPLLSSLSLLHLLSSPLLFSPLLSSTPLLSPPLLYLSPLPSLVPSSPLFKTKENQGHATLSQHPRLLICTCV